MCAVKDAYTICVRCLGVHTKPFIFVKNNAFIQGLSHNLIIFLSGGQNKTCFADNEIFMPSSMNKFPVSNFQNI